MSKALNIFDILRTPRGILVLIALTFLGAIGLGIFEIANRPFFEKYVREKYQPPTKAATDYAKQLGNFTEGRKIVAALSTPELNAVYDAWMQTPPGDWPPGAPAALIWGGGDVLLPRARITLLCGSPEQRGRAMQFLAQSRHPGAAPLLAAAMTRARARKETELTQLAEQCLQESRQRLDQSTPPAPLKPIQNSSEKAPAPGANNPIPERR